MTTADANAQIAAFEMLIQRLNDVESTMLRTERVVRDHAASQDVREVMLVPVIDLVGKPIRTHDRLYKLCERLEDLLYDSVDISETGANMVHQCVARLRELGANKITFLMLCQISNMTGDIDAVLDVAFDRALVPAEDALAFALHAEDLVSTRHQSDREDQDRLFERVDIEITKLRLHWRTLDYKPGSPWMIGHY